jgi:hypothetical protein
MTITKEHLEFHALDLAAGWHVPAGYPTGIEQKILSGSLDESAGSGSRTRLLRFQPGVFTTKPFIHDYWEEVYLLDGDLSVGTDANGQGGTSFLSPTYACRPPQTPHGPFSSRGGCLLLEVHFYGD